MKLLRFPAALAILAGVCAVYAAGHALAQNDPSVGTWKLNLAKSKYSPGPAPTSQTVTITAAGMGLKVSAKGVDSAGKPTGADYTVAPDGKDAPVTGNPAWDSTYMTRIDASTTELTRKKAGKVVQTARRAISADGKTMTTTTTGTNEKGEKVSNVAVYDRQ